MAPFWHRWSDFSILNLSVFHLTDKCFAISNLINLRTILFLEYRKTPETLRFRGILRLDTMLSCDNKSIFRLYYSMIVATRPDPTVRPPSRYLNTVFLHIFYAFGWQNPHKTAVFAYRIFICLSSWHRFGTVGTSSSFTTINLNFLFQQYIEFF